MSSYEELTETHQFACRVIADHARSTAFAIADGILPGNEGRNYVLRKIMRRAIYHGREHLGLNDAFFYKVCDFVVDQMHGAFPELETQRDFIGKMVRLEEERFGNTVTVGLRKIEEVAKKIRTSLDQFKLELNAMMTNPDTALDKYREILFSHEGSPEEADATAQQAYELERAKYPEDTMVEFLKLIWKFRIPPFLFKSIAPELRVKYQNENNPFGWFLQTVGVSDAYFELNFSRELINFIDRRGAPADKRFLSEYISEEFDNFVTENMFGDIILTERKDVQLFLLKLDIFLSGTEHLGFVTFLDFARYFDTFGTPPDLIRLSLEDLGISFSEESFNERFDLALAAIQQQSSLGKTERKSEVSPVYAEVLEKVGSNIFGGYDTTKIVDAKILAILDGEKDLQALKLGEKGVIVLDKTPFYAESGGQVGDQGVLMGVDQSALVSDTFSPIPGLILHKVSIRVGEFRVGDVVEAEVDTATRDATRRNHTATHLVHAALKEVLGTHVKQAGSVVAPNYLRFDFTHYQAMTAAEIAEVEDLVNRYILANEPVTTDMMKLEDAMRSGAVAMFGEKYGGEVRVLSVGDGQFSKELCGGTHVRATGDIGSFKITSDEAIASGVRRIRAITGFDAFERFREDERLIDASLGALKTQRDNLPDAIARLQEELKRTRREMDDLKLKIATGSLGNGASADGDEAREINGVKVIARQVDGLDANGTRQLSDTLLARLKSGVVVLGRTDEGKVGIIVRVSNDLTGKIKAGDIIREIAPIVGGRGGGKPDMAEGGGTEPGKLTEAIEASYSIVERMLAKE